MFTLQNKGQSGFLYSQASVLCMAVVPLFNKFALATLDGPSSSLYNALIAGLICFFLNRRNQNKGTFTSLYLGLGILNGLGLIFLFNALDVMAPAKVSFVARSYLIFSIILAVIILKEKISKEKWIFMPFFLSGLFMFVYKENGVFNLEGFIYVLGSSLCFAGNNLLIKKYLKDTPTMTSLFWVNASSALFIGLWMLGNGSALSFSWSGLAWNGIAALFGSLLGLHFYYKSLENLPFYMANLYRAFGPLLTFFITIPFFPVQLNSINYWGMGLILSSVFGLSLFQFFQKRSKGKSLRTLRMGHHTKINMNQSRA